MSEEGLPVCREAVRQLLTRVSEAISLSWAIYEPGASWPSSYGDASRESLCGFARRANITSGRCRDEESRMAEVALATGHVQRGNCWQGTARWVVPLLVDGRPALAVALCGFGVDPEAERQDYLPEDIAVALGLHSGAPRAQSFPGDSGIDPDAAVLLARVLEKVLQFVADSSGLPGFLRR